MPVEQQRVMQAYRYAIAPTPAQERALLRDAGARRFAYNWAVARLRETRAVQLDEYREHGKSSTKFPTFIAMNNAFNAWKATPDAPEWVAELPQVVFLWGIYEAADALRRYFDGRKAGRRVGFPTFKKRRTDTARFKVTAAKLLDNRHLRLPKIADPVKVCESMRKLSRAVERGAKVKNATVTRSSSGRWFVAFAVETVREIRTGPSRRQHAGGDVGVDLGIKTWAALSTGDTVPNSRPLARWQRRLKTAQQALARSQRGSNRRARRVARVGRLHARVANLRREAVHQLTTYLVHRYAEIAIEDLNVKGMSASAAGTIDKPGRKVCQKAGLNRSILDAAFGEIRRQLEYKTTWYGSALRVVGRFEPTSQTCSACGWRNPNLTLAERTFRCDSCDLVLDRDVNAAVNICNAARAARAPAQSGNVARSSRETVNARRDQVRPTTPRGGRRRSMKREAGGAGDPARQTGTPSGQPLGVPTAP